MFPSIEPSEVGTTGLCWLIISYGYILFMASNLISEGSDLLLLVPSLAGLVGSVVLPLLGAVPDGAIMLFSGLGDIETAQETLSVGVGALAGSTIMLLTVPWALSIYSGRVDIIKEATTDTDEGEGKEVLIANYTLEKPKLSPGRQSLSNTGVVIEDVVSSSGKIMILTTLPYLLIQGPAFFGSTHQSKFALYGLILCTTFFVSYLVLQFRMSKESSPVSNAKKDKRIAVVRKLLQNGKISLSGALAPEVSAILDGSTTSSSGGPEYGSIPETTGEEDSNLSAVKAYFKKVLKPTFSRYDTDGNGSLVLDEVKHFFKDFHERISPEDCQELFDRFDINKSGDISYDEFVDACLYFIVSSSRARSIKNVSTPPEMMRSSSRSSSVIADNMLKSSSRNTLSHDNEGDGGEEEEEEEEIPEDLFDLDPEEQQKAIKKRAFGMLALGTALVLIFSDPMVDVMQEVAVRVGLSPFYISFILAPLASNASEVLASQYYAAKKTRKTITVALSALEGAAIMNNTFCLAIFMGLIYFRGLSWKYSAETITILLVQFIIGYMVNVNAGGGKSTNIMTSKQALFILCIFPFSIAFVAILEGVFGMD